MFVDDVLSSFEALGVISLPSDLWSSQSVKETVYRSLSMMNRFNGHLRIPYSVLQHSLSVANYSVDLCRIFSESYCEHERCEVFLMALLHDISESVTGDVIYPMKDKLVWTRAKSFEAEFRQWFLEHCYGLKYVWNNDLYEKYVNRADRELGVMEMIGVTDDKRFASADSFAAMFNGNRVVNQNDFDKVVFLAVKQLEKFI